MLQAQALSSIRYLLLFFWIPMQGLFSTPGRSIKQDSDDDFHRYSRKIGNENGLHLLSVTTSDPVGEVELYHPWAALFTSKRKVTLEEGKLLANLLANLLVQHVKTDPVFQEYYKKKAKDYAHWTPPPPPQIPSSQDVAFKIAFWDENVDRPLAPYLADIRFLENQFYFSFADPKTQALQPPITEPYVEAFPP